MDRSLFVKIIYENSEMYSVRHAILLKRSFSVYVQFYCNAHFRRTTCDTKLKRSFSVLLKRPMQQYLLFYEFMKET